MHRQDFRKLIGADSRKAEYLPVAGLLASGYAVAGYFNDDLNGGLEEACVLINARLVDLRGAGESARSPIKSFNDFIEEIVQRQYRSGTSQAPDPEAAGRDVGDHPGAAIPLTAVAYREFVVLYPVAHISELMKATKKSLPTFLDIDNRSEILKLLRTRLW